MFCSGSDQMTSSRCARCHVKCGDCLPRRLTTSVATLGLPEPACRDCASGIDAEREREAKGVMQVDRAVRRYHESLAA